MLELHCIFILWTTAIQPTRSVCQIIQAYIFLLNLSLRSMNSRLNTTIHPRLSLTSYPNGWDWKQQLKVYIIVNHHGWKTNGYNQLQNRPGFLGFCWCHITSQSMCKWPLSLVRKNQTPFSDLCQTQQPLCFSAITYLTSMGYWSDTSDFYFLFFLDHHYYVEFNSSLYPPSPKLQHICR